MASTHDFPSELAKTATCLPSGGTVPRTTVFLPLIASSRSLRVLTDVILGIGGGAAGALAAPEEKGVASRLSEAEEVFGEGAEEAAMVFGGSGVRAGS